MTTDVSWYLFYYECNSQMFYFKNCKQNTYHGYNFIKTLSFSVVITAIAWFALVTLICLKVNFDEWSIGQTFIENWQREDGPSEMQGYTLKFQLKWDLLDWEASKRALLKLRGIL